MPRKTAKWTPERIQALRHALKESTETFGQRFARSGRTIEDWEQGRSRPDAFIQRALDQLEAEIKP